MDSPFGNVIPSDKEGFTYELCEIDADSLLHKCANVVQERYINVTHKPTKYTKEFKNITTFYGGWRKKDGGWLAEQNENLKAKGKPVLLLEDFDIEQCRRTPDYVPAVTEVVQVEIVEDGMLTGEIVSKTLIKEHAKGFKDDQHAIDSAVSAFDYKIGNIKKKMDAVDYLLLIGGKENYRRDVAKIQKYKGSRPPKPLLFNQIEEAIKKKYASKIQICEWEESEDVVGKDMYLNHLEFLETGVYRKSFAYIDKDLDMICSPRINYDNLEAGYTIPVEFECWEYFVKQCVTGDSTDDILGLPDVSIDLKEKYGLRKCKGVGKGSANVLFEGCSTTKELLERLTEAYRSFYVGVTTFTSWDGEEMKYTWLDYLQENAVLLWMRQKDDEIIDMKGLLEEYGVIYD